MPSTTPLTDAIEALTRYANETTGASDTTLSDAVGTLVAGYGGGGGGSYADFSAGNIQAIIFNGTEYIQTDYLGRLDNLFAEKVMPTGVVGYEYYMSVANGIKRTAFQRNSTTQNIGINSCNTAGSANFGTCTVVQNEAIMLLLSGFQFKDDTIATLPLLLGAGYYLGKLESQRSIFNFYGLNIMDVNGDFVARFMPWLEGTTPCVKELISGSLYYATEGTLGYIDNNGTVHN